MTIFYALFVGYFTRYTWSIVSKISYFTVGISIQPLEQTLSPFEIQSMYVITILTVSFFMCS